MSNLSFDSEEVESAIEDVIKSGFVDYTKISEIAQMNVKKHFFQGEGPDGKWKEKKGGDPSFLQKSGRLLKSIKQNALKTKAQLFTEVEYAAIHNFGGDAGKDKKAKIPKREFFWFDERAIQDMINNIIKTTFNAWRR